MFQRWGGRTSLPSSCSNSVFVLGLKHPIQCQEKPDNGRPRCAGHHSQQSLRFFSQRVRFQSTDHDTGFIGGTQQLCPALTPCSLIHFEASNRKCPFCSWVASASFLDAVTKIPEKASAVVLTTTKATQREEFIKLTAPEG